MECSLEEEKQRFEIHAVLFPYPAQGHIVPSLLFAQRLIENGIAVSFVAFEDCLPRVYEALEGFQIKANSLGVVALRGPERPPENWNGTGHDDFDGLRWMVVQCLGAEAEFEEMVGGMKRASPPGTRWCIVSDMLVSWTQDVANRLGVPRYIFYPSPASILAGAFHVKALLAQSRLPLPASAVEGEEVFVEIPGMPPIERSAMHSALLGGAPNFVQDFYIKNSLRVHDAAGILINTFEALEGTALSAIRDNRLLNPNRVRILPVGPLLPREEVLNRRAKELISREEQCMLWLSKQPRRSVVYISLGSIVVLRLDQIEELAFGLEASQQRFLWVLRSPDSSAAKQEVLPEGFRGERGLVVRDSWVPQLAILGHESTGVFLTHCGWNSSMESLCMGVFMLALPSLFDQALNARMMEELQVAWRVSKTSRDSLSRHRIDGLIRRAMEEPREKIESLMATARKMAAKNSSIKDFLLS